jgi:hypothetical protein
MRRALLLVVSCCAPLPVFAQTSPFVRAIYRHWRADLGRPRVRDHPVPVAVHRTGSGRDYKAPVHPRAGGSLRPRGREAGTAGRADGLELPVQQAWLAGSATKLAAYDDGLLHRRQQPHHLTADLVEVGNGVADKD